MLVSKCVKKSGIVLSIINMPVEYIKNVSAASKSLKNWTYYKWVIENLHAVEHTQTLQKQIEVESVVF